MEKIEITAVFNQVMQTIGDVLTSDEAAVRNQLCWWWKRWVDEWRFWLFSERWQQPKKCNFTHIDKTKAIYIWLILHVTYTMEFHTQCTIWHTLSMTKFDDDKDVDIGVYCWGRRGRRWECELWGVCQHDLQRGKWRNVSRRGFL